MRRFATALGILALAAAGAARADEPFPSRSLTIVNPFPPGGQADLTGRPLTASLERIFKQPVVLVTWGDTDAARLAEVIKRIGRVETK